MKIINFAFASLLLLAGPGLIAEPTTPSNPPAVDPTAEALAILQSSYADFPSLHYQPGDHISDLIARSNGRIGVISPDTEGPLPIITAALSEGIVYWRLGSFTPKKDWTDLAGDLKTMIEVQHVAGAVLDLRSNTTPDDYAGAAQVLSFFVPADTALYKYLPKKADGHLSLSMLNRHFDGPLIVLTNGQTSGAAEALAGCLKSDGALVVGQTTAGTGFAEHTLSNGQILRFAMAVPVQPGDTMIRPVTPDIALIVDEHNEKAALTLIRDNHVLDVIQEASERHRMSEASLVNGQDPEWDAYLTSLERGPVLLSLPRIHDPVLTTALDSLRAIRLSEHALPTQATANASPPGSTSIQ